VHKEYDKETKPTQSLLSPIVSSLPPFDAQKASPDSYLYFFLFHKNTTSKQNHSGHNSFSFWRPNAWFAVKHVNGPSPISYLDTMNPPFSLGPPFGMVKKIKSEWLAINCGKMLKNFRNLDLRGILGLGWSSGGKLDGVEIRA
jgi:hypothetical protein